MLLAEEKDEGCLVRSCADAVSFSFASQLLMICKKFKVNIDKKNDVWLGEVYLR